MIKKNITDREIIEIIRLTDYYYIISLARNSLKFSDDVIVNEWKIFSTHSINIQLNNEDCNMLYLLQNMISHDEFDYEILLWTIHIYENICIKYADLIDNYVYLFGSIYVSANIINEKYLSEIFLTKIFGIDVNIVKKMINTINNYMDNNDIYFGIDEKKKILNLINNAN
jgi:hypothetical protein